MDARTHVFFLALDWDNTTRDTREDARDGKLLAPASYEAAAIVEFSDDSLTDAQMAEAMFEQTNIGDMGDLRVRSMSVGDVAMVVRMCANPHDPNWDGDATLMLCAPTGWVELKCERGSAANRIAWRVLKGDRPAKVQSVQMAREAKAVADAEAWIDSGDWDVRSDEDYDGEYGPDAEDLALSAAYNGTF